MRTNNKICNIQDLVFLCWRQANELWPDSDAAALHYFTGQPAVPNWNYDRLVSENYIAQRPWVRFWGPKNVASSCTHLGPAQVMEVIIIDV